MACQEKDTESLKALQTELWWAFCISWPYAFIYIRLKPLQLDNHHLSLLSQQASAFGRTESSPPLSCSGTNYTLRSGHMIQCNTPPQNRSYWNIPMLVPGAFCMRTVEGHWTLQSCTCKRFHCFCDINVHFIHHFHIMARYCVIKLNDCVKAYLKLLNIDVVNNKRAKPILMARFLFVWLVKLMSSLVYTVWLCIEKIKSFPFTIILQHKNTSRAG